MKTFDQILDEEFLSIENLLEVTPSRGRRVRGGKVVRKRKCPKGYKLVGGTRCVRQGAKERRVRRVAGRKAARKGKAARKRNFKRSIKLRQRRKLKKAK